MFAGFRHHVQCLFSLEPLKFTLSLAVVLIRCGVIVLDLAVCLFGTMALAWPSISAHERSIQLKSSHGFFVFIKVFKGDGDCLTGDNSSEHISLVSFRYDNSCYHLLR